MKFGMKKGLLAAVWALACVAGGGALAQSTARPMTLIMPIAPGSTLETMYRMLAGKASKLLAQPVVVENRIGAGGIIGVRALMASRNDGSVMAMVTNGFVVTLPLSDPNFRIEPGKDYLPVTLISEAPLLLAAHPSAPFRNVRGMLAYARKNPGKLSVAAAVRGSNPHLSWELIKLLAGVNINVINYQGEPQSVPDILNGLVLAEIVSPTLKPHVDAGKLIGIATTGQLPWPIFPSLPTINDSGIEGMVVTQLSGFVVPAGTPSAEVSRLHAAFSQTLLDPEVKEKLQEYGQIIRGGGPEEFTAIIKSETLRWGSLMQRLAGKI